MGPSKLGGNIRLLRHTPSLFHDRNALWLAALGAEGAKKHNGQMDVVAALWVSGFIAQPSG